MKELAERVIKCQHWRWMAGMLVRYSDGKPWYRLTEADSYGIRPPKYRPPDPRRAWPDLTDPATLGCLLALVREAWEPRRGDDSIASTIQVGKKWGVGARAGSETLALIVLPSFASEAEALVAALEAAE
jgi:hypothetical protein